MKEGRATAMGARQERAPTSLWDFSTFSTEDGRGSADGAGQSDGAGFGSSSPEDGNGGGYGMGTAAGEGSGHGSTLTQDERPGLIERTN